MEVGEIVQVEEVSSTSHEYLLPAFLFLNDNITPVISQIDCIDNRGESGKDDTSYIHLEKFTFILILNARLKVVMVLMLGRLV